MKKILILTGILVITSLGVNAGVNAGVNIGVNEGVNPPEHNYKRTFDNPPPPPVSRQDMAKKEAEFEQRLGLTEEQKKQARALREEGFEKIKPVIDKIRIMEQEAETIKRTNPAQQTAQEEKLNKLNNDITNLRKQAHEIRVENMRSFESILTPEQKKIFKEMKQEGRKKFHENHPVMNQKYPKAKN